MLVKPRRLEQGGCRMVVVVVVVVARTLVELQQLKGAARSPALLLG